jgi:cell division protein FtsI (penicillin-binding protein 3)
MQKGLARPDTVINTYPGKITISGSTITDSHIYPQLSLNEVIQKSSNVGTVRLAMQTQPREMWDLYSQVGFGQKPQVPFPGAVSGRLRAHKTWRPIEQATMSYGYGLSASLFQLARSYSVFARDGQLIPVTLLKTNEAVQGVRVMSELHADQVRKMLHMAAGPGGTAPLAQTMGYSVGGKTGTARKQEGKGYADKKYRGFFVGLAPVEQPRIVVAVMIDEPSQGGFYGGDVAAPVFSETVQQSLRIMGVQPDLSVKPLIVAAVPEDPV